MQACTGERGLGYTCEQEYVDPDELCFKEIGKCHYKLVEPPSQSMIVSVNVSCVCIRTNCKILTVNIKFNVSVPLNENVCICNVYSVRGCDIDFVQSQISLVNIYAHYKLYENIEPISLGTNITLLKQLVTHPEMLEQIRKLKDQGRDIDIAIHHSATQIETVLDRIKTSSQNSWWAKFFAPDPSQYNTWKLIFTPVVLLCILQAIVFLCHLYMSMRKLRALTWTRSTRVLFHNDRDPSVWID